jgi:hypothetical protein
MSYILIFLSCWNTTILMIGGLHRKPLIYLWYSDHAQKSHMKFVACKTCQHALAW